MSTLVVDTLTNQEPQLCKAWCTFDGSAADITATMTGYNVSSITDTTTGQYTVNLTNSLADNNYSCTTAGEHNYPNVSVNSKNISSFNVYSYDRHSAVYFDAKVNVQVFR